MLKPRASGLEGLISLLYLVEGLARMICLSCPHSLLCSASLSIIVSSVSLENDFFFSHIVLKGALHYVATAIVVMMRRFLELGGVVKGTGLVSQR